MIDASIAIPIIAILGLAAITLITWGLIAEARNKRETLPLFADVTIHPTGIRVNGHELPGLALGNDITITDQGDDESTVTLTIYSKNIVIVDPPITSNIIRQSN